VAGVDITSSFFRIFYDPFLYRWLDDDTIHAFGVRIKRRLPLGPASPGVEWLSTYVWLSVVGLARRTPRPTTLGDNVAATMASRVDPHIWGRFAILLHHPGSNTRAEHWTLCAVDGEASPPTAWMAGSLRPSAASPIDLAAHAVEERRLAGLVLWWISLLASAMGSSFVADEWIVKTSPPTLQQQVQEHCGIFFAYWAAYNLNGGDVHTAPALDTLAYRVFMKRALLSTEMAEALCMDQSYCALIDDNPLSPLNPVFDVKRLSTKAKHVKDDGGYAGEPHTIALAHRKIDSTSADGRVVAPQPPPLAPLLTPTLAQPLVPSTPVGGGSEGLHHADPDSCVDDNADNGVDVDVVSGEADSGGDDAENGADVNYNDVFGSDDEDIPVGLLHKSEIRPGQVGVTRLDEICSSAGTPPPGRRTRAHLEACSSQTGCDRRSGWLGCATVLGYRGS